MVELWPRMPVYYLLTVAIEAPILCIGLSEQHPLSRRVYSGLWLTACTYPFVWMVAPVLFNPTTERIAYLAVAETVAHFGECVLFWLAFRPLTHFWRDMAAVFGANLASFGVGELLAYLQGAYG